MKEYDPSQRKELMLAVKEKSQEVFEPAYNIDRLSSYNGQLFFTANEIYWFYNDEIAEQAMNPWSIEISEISTYSKKGLAGYVITLIGGKELRFSNVFRKMRNGITDAIERRLREHYNSLYED